MKRLTDDSWQEIRYVLATQMQHTNNSIFSIDISQSSDKPLMKLIQNTSFCSGHFDSRNISINPRDFREKPLEQLKDRPNKKVLKGDKVYIGLVVKIKQKVNISQI